MNQRDQEEMRHDGFSEVRRANFEAGKTKSRAWERAHPRSIEDYVDFLRALQDLFGSFLVDHEPWRGKDFRL